jgi:hypothetical protein
MLNYALGILGIAISVGLFVIGYRQTVGAKKERVGAANAELEKTLLRRIVLDKFAPSLLDLSRMIEGKARDYRVRPDDLLSEAQLLNTMFTRIMESDLIPAEQRESILGRIVPPLVESESEPTQEEYVAVIESSERLQRARSILISLMALLASLVGGVVAFIPRIRNVRAELSATLPALLATVGASLVAITLAYSVSRLGAGPEESSNRATELSDYMEFEERVLRMLRETGAVVRPSQRDQGFDFLADSGGKKIAIEVAGWSRPVPTAIMSRVVARLRDAAERIGASESIIVTKAPTAAIKQSFQDNDNSVKIMTVRELRNYLAHNS